MKAAELASWISAMRAKGGINAHLRHLTLSGTGETSAHVDTWDLETPPRELAAVVLDAAREDASATGGPQRYALQIQGADETTIGRRVWRVLGERFAEDGTHSEPPNVAGLTAQLMRHLEARERQQTAKDSLVLETLQALHGQALERVNKLEARELQTMELLEKLTSAQHQRELDVRKADRESELQTKALTRIEPLIPMLISKVFKTPLVPAQSGNAIDALLTSISEEQAAELQKVLTTEQFIALGEIYRERAAQQKAGGNA